MARGDNISAREIDAMIVQLEKRIDQLKKLYERYFIGIDKRPPLAMRRQVVREVFEMEQVYINNTAQKFRLRSVVQRFNTLKTYWTRTMRQIEEGTYHRDRSRAERRKKKRERREARREEQEQSFEVDLEADFMGDLADVDLEEVFNDPAEPAPASSAPAQSAGPSDAEKERIKQARLAEIQRKLGLGAGSEPAPAEPQTSVPTPAPPQTQAPELSAREQKLQAMRQKLNQKDAPTPSATSQPNSRSEKLNRLKKKVARQKSSPRTINRARPASDTGSRSPRETGNQRVVQRPGATSSGDDDAKRVYKSLIEAKRRCNEPTDNLSFDAVKRSMDKQRQSLQQKRGSRNVDFQVVIKDGRAFLKPETKD